MKKYFVAIAAAVLVMIAIPLFTVKNNTFELINRHFNSKNEIKSEILTGILAAQFKKDYCDEGLTAAAIILNSNYKSGSKYKTISKKQFIKKYKNGEAYYSKIENTVKRINNKVITYKGKPVTVPCSYVTDGKCESDYPYIRNTDNPWDYFNKSFTFENKSGVSLNSINELCKKGLSCEESLGRYFKDVKIEQG